MGGVGGAAGATAYPLVHIFNSTPYYAKGKVAYASIFCADDSYDVIAWKDWTASSRGVCLVTKVGRPAQPGRSH